MTDAVWAVTCSHFRLDIHFALKLVILAVGQPAEAIVDLTEPRSRILPLNLLHIFDRVEGEVYVEGLRRVTVGGVGVRIDTAKALKCRLFHHVALEL